MTDQTRTEPLDRLAEIQVALERQLPVKDTPSRSEGGVDVTLAVHFGTRANLIDSILDAIRPSLIAEAREAARLRTAAEWVVQATEAVRDAINCIGHEGTPHDRVLHFDPCTSDPDVHVYSDSTDCAACGGAQYGTEDDLNGAIGDLRAALGLERRPWEYERQKPDLVRP